MALDEGEGEGGGGGGCWRCGGSGFARDWLSEAEARRMFGEDSVPRDGTFRSASVTSVCECPAGQRLRRMMDENGGDA
jgi:hypothetical protein